MSPNDDFLPLSANGDIPTMSPFADFYPIGSDMQIRTDKDLGLVIRARRKELGLDQSALASRVGVSRQWVVEVEKGKSRAEVALVLRTMGVLGLEFRAVVAGAADTEGSPDIGLVDIDAVVEGLRNEEPK